MVWRFNPRLPGGRRPPSAPLVFTLAVFQSTPSGGKATPSLHTLPRRSQVSIHAFRGEGDRRPRSGDANEQVRFNPRLPGGRRPVPVPQRPHAEGGFNPRLPGGRRRIRPSSTEYSRRFQSTPSGGKATQRGRGVSQHAIVSIHAFRGEGDPADRVDVRDVISFNPRLPGGRRLGARGGFSLLQQFQSTPSGGKATRRAPVALPTDNCFNPRLPGGRRPADRVDVRDVISFNPRLPGGRRRRAPARWLRCGCFNPRLPGGRRLLRSCTRHAAKSVSIHAFRGEGDSAPG